MPMSNKAFAIAALLAIYLPQTADLASAVEADAFAKAMTKAVAQNNEGSATYGSASKNGDQILISDFSVTQDNGATLNFSEVIVADPRQEADGVFRAGNIDFKSGTMSGEVTGSIQSATAANLILLPQALVDANDLPQSILYDSGSATGISIKPEDQEAPITVETVTINLGDIQNYIPQTSTGAVQAVSVPSSYFPADEPVSLKALGYDNIILDIAWEGGRDVDTKLLSIAEIRLSMRDGGSLALAGEIGNVPSSGNVDPNAAMEVLAGLQLQSLSLIYQDNSLAGRILDTVAQSQGVNREQYVNQLAAALPFFLSALRNPDFQAKVADAIGAFLKDPQSLAIKLAPETPVTGAEIMGLVGTAPQSLPDRLNATITANGN